MSKLYSLSLSIPDGGGVEFTEDEIIILKALDYYYGKLNDLKDKGEQNVKRES